MIFAARCIKKSFLWRSLSVLVFCGALATVTATHTQKRGSGLSSERLDSSLQTQGSTRQDGVDPVPTLETIPKRLIFTGPVDPAAIVAKNKQWIDTDVEHRFHDYNMMVESVRNISERLEKHGVHGAFSAFSSLRPIAFQADLWRYMILWDIGGLYLDHKLVLQRSLDSWLQWNSTSVFTCRDGGIVDPFGTVYWNAIIASPPRHKGMLDAIRRSLRHIKERRYTYAFVDSGYAPVYFTGPGVFSRSLWRTGSHVVSIGVKRNVEGDKNRSAEVVDQNGNPILYVDEAVHHQSHGGVYNFLFWNHAVFCDEPIADCERPTNPLYFTDPSQDCVPLESDPCIKRKTNVSAHSSARLMRKAE